MRKWSIVVAVGLLLSGCGAVYVSPQVDASDDSVDVIPMTAQSIAAANQSPFLPKAVPDVFYRAANVSGSGRGPIPSPEPSLAPQQRPAALTTRLPPDPAPGPYRIGVGDVLILATKTAGNTVQELTGLLAAQNSRQGYTVQDDGAIAVPDVGRIPLSGLTLEEAEAQLFQSLVQNGIEPTFSLEIAEFNSQRVSLGGALAAPVIIPITLTPLLLDEALTRAGGITADDMDQASIRLYRGGTLYQIPLSAYLSQPDYQKIRLVAGDSVFIDTSYELEKARAFFQEQIALAEFRQQSRNLALAELNTEIELRRAALAERRSNFQELVALDAIDRDYVYLSGEVAEPGRFPMPLGRKATLADALFSGKGFSSETGNPTQIYVLRGAAETDRVTAWQLDARNVANLVLATKMELRPNDIIFIAEQPVTRWNRVVQQIVPSLITSGTTLATN